MTDDDAKKLARALVDEVFARLGGGLVRRDIKPDNAEPQFMKVSAFAKSRGFARSTVQGYLKAGMPSIAMRGGKRVDAKAADEWIRLGAAGRGGLNG